MILRTAAIATLGCKTNQFESAALHEALAAAGYEIVPFEAGADLVVVNTCTVTSATDAQSRNLVRRARRLNAGCRVVVTGCYAQVDPAALRALPGVALVLGNEEKNDLLRHLATGEEVVVGAGRAAAKARPPALAGFAGRSRAFVQIQNGCDAFCSYCIIPYARGPSRSVPPDSVLAQVERLAPDYPEIVLTGIHIGGYGADLQPPVTLLDLVRRIETSGVRRLRLGSIEPTEIPSALIDAVAASKILCPHFHIPLQAGDDAVLRRMNRHYDSAFFRDLVAAIHARLPEGAIGLDVIAGFPGETEEEFANTCRLIEELPVSHLHVFPFSRRPGTPAATMPGQVPAAAIKARAARLREIGAAKEAAFARRFLGRTLEVMVEGGKGKGGLRQGLTGNYLTVRFAGDAGKEGELLPLRITDWRDGALFGEAP